MNHEEKSEHRQLSAGINKLLFCNLVPRKRGGFEDFLLALGSLVGGTGGRLCIVFGGNPEQWFADALKARGISWRVLDGWTDGSNREHPWKFCAGALRAIREIRPDVAAVHFGNELPAICTILLSRALGRRGMRWLWLQNQQIGDPTALTRKISRIRLLSFFVDRFAAVYNGGRRSMVLRGIPERQVTVIRNGINDPQRLRDKGWLRTLTGAGAEDVIAVSVNSLIPRKRVEYQIEALGTLVRKGLKVRLVVVGDGPEHAELEALSGRLNVSDRVHFLGLRNDVPEILFESDLALLTSTAEANAYSTIEAMAVGIPSVVTDAGAAREQVEDGRSGYVTERDDLPCFTSCFQRLVSDPDLRRQMGRAARLKWEKEYRLKDTVQLYHECCVALAGKR